MILVRVQEADFDAGGEMQALQGEGVGGIASFIGTVRAKDTAEDRLVAMHLEHYPGMTEQAMRKIADNAASRWPLQNCTLIHRVGKLLPGDNIVFVGASSAHREAALSATAFLIDWLKTSAPFWKREEFASGASVWVAACEADDHAAAAWNT